ncbi:7-carboxy-7-deazaguanine synthase QueE [Flavobacteriales bacterium]|nr:7-carboxy-7-deazaguanine synthase QueE [Flavobacteriales bacterium]
MKKEHQELVDKGIMLPLMEAFYTIQGEGFYSGTPAFFLRIGGCDVGCHWCDVKESWNADLHPPTHIDDMLINIQSSPAKTVVVTGGEPLMWNMGPLTELLKRNGINVHIETSGAYPLSGTFDWICLSPKKNSPPQKAIIPVANELKVIIHNLNDFKWAEEFSVQCKHDCKLFLQPEWSKEKEMMPKIIDYVMSKPQWNISLQTHKYMGIP